MTKIINQITINAPIEKIWKILANVGELDKYDPTVQKSLEPISKLIFPVFKQDFHARQMNKTKKVVGVALITGYQSAVVLKPGIEPFDLPSSPVSAQRSPVLRLGHPPISPMRGNESDMPFPEQDVMRVAVIGAVADEETREMSSKPLVHRLRRKGNLMRRCGGDMHSDWQAGIIANHQYLRAFSAFGLPYARPPFLALAKVPSM